MSTIIKHKEFPKFKSWTMDLCGRPLTIEVGKVAELASASAMVKARRHYRHGGRHRLPRPRDGIDFFPCLWSLRRSCMPWAASPAASCAVRAAPLPAVLASRLIDRPMRPCSPMTSATTCASSAP